MSDAVVWLFGIVIAPFVIGYLYGRGKVDHDKHPEYYE